MVAALEAHGLRFVGKDETGTRMEVVELAGHPFFVASQVIKACMLCAILGDGSRPICKHINLLQVVGIFLKHNKHVQVTSV